MRAYPVERLRKMTRAEAVQLSRWARSAPLAALERRGRQARGWLGAPLELRLGTAVQWSDEAPASEGAYVLLEGLRPAGLFLGPRIASAIVARSLGAGIETIGGRGPLGAIEAGVLAYAVARWLGEGPFSVGAVFGYAPALVEAVGPRLTWPFELSLGEARGRGALWLPDSVGIRASPPAAAPGWLPVTLLAEAGRATLSAAEIADFAPGDVLIPDRIDVDLQGMGTLNLRVRSTGLSLVCRNSAKELEFLGIEEDALAATRGRRVSVNEGPNMSDETIAKMGDTPVTLHVEIARVEMSLSEVAGLSVGEVLRTGRTLSEQVTLRAGERAVARGELVDVDGELGVQISEVLSAS